MKPAKLQSVTMAILITVTLFLCPTGSMAQTSVSGTINGKTWTPANSPYLVTGDINVVNLEIEPGVTVLFDGDYVFGVTGILKAVGTAQDSIVFTITDSVAGWRGISFNSVSSRFDLAYCKIEFATNSGIRLETSIVTMKNCTISNNSSDNGGGVYISGSSIAILRNCTIINNVATSGGGIYISFDGAATLINCIIAYNVASTSGGGIFNQGEATVTNCVVVYNSNNGIRRESGAVTVKNSIIFFNSSAQITPEFNINVPVKYCDVQGGFSGTGNINLYPIFVDNELLALPDFSPCVDAGDPDSSYFDICFPPSLGNERNDMGAYGGPEACGWLSSVPDTTADNSVLISIVDTTAAPTDTLNIPISFENGMGIAGAEISITFDSTLLTAFGAQTTSLTNNFTLTDSVSSGKIALTMASNDAITANSGDLVILSFRVNANAMQGDATTLTFEELTVFDDGSNEIPATAVNGLFTVCCEPGTGLTLMITPDSAIVAQGDTLTFMAAGLDSMNNPVAVNPSWTAACGIFQPNTGATVVFTADTEAFGECLIIAQQADASDTVRVFIGVRGDINADTTVNVGDAIICLKIIAGDTLPPNPPGHLTPTAFEQWTADVNQDDAINSADALLILYTALDRLFPKTNIIANEDDAVIKIPAVAAQALSAGEIVTIPIVIERRTDVYAADLTVSYDPDELTLLATEAATARSFMKENARETGTIKFAMINTEGLVNSQGELVNMKFRVRRNVASGIQLELDHVNLFNAQAKTIRTQMQTGAADASLPEIYQLQQNHPNPFNPETTIRFQLPQDGQVSLKIYNLTGQLVRTLVDGRMQAGRLTKTWNGRNEFGQEVPSGVYFYQLRAVGGKVEKTRKMVLVR